MISSDASPMILQLEEDARGLELDSEVVLRDSLLKLWERNSSFETMKENKREEEDNDGMGREESTSLSALLFFRR